MVIEKLLTFICGEPEEINGGDRCPTYLYRWHLCNLITKDRKVYIHKFVGNDWSKNLHDHPRKFISIGLWGSYLEHTQDEWLEEFEQKFTAPWFRSFPAEHRHRITTPFGICWTFVIVLPITRQWGFWNDGVWIYWKDYVFGDKKDIADKMRDC